jgi:hypothetical protein
MADDPEGGGGEPHHLTDLGIGAWCLALSLGILSRSLLSKILPLPYTVVLLILGLLIGVVMIKAHPNPENIFAHSIDTWVDIPPDAILFGILPILIFEASKFNFVCVCVYVCV